jgi:hypothetical protein
MDEKRIAELLTSRSNEIRELRTNLPILGGFLQLVQRIDSLKNMEKRFYEKNRSLYRATAQGLDMGEVEDKLKEFFGLPVKPKGSSLPLKMRRNPSVKRLNGIEKDQSLFIKKLKYGEFYGALWPWRRKPGLIEIHLGYSVPNLKPGDQRQLEKLLNKVLSQQMLSAIDSGVGGEIRGISLPSFLQMSEMEGSTFILKVSDGNGQGRLYVNGGNLIDAETGNIRGREAAYRIISWDNIAIQIEDASGAEEAEDRIQQPLMHVLMESLKIKDEKPSATKEKPDSPDTAAVETKEASTETAAVFSVEKPRVSPFERIEQPAPAKIPKSKKRITILMAVLGLIGLVAIGTNLTLEYLQAKRIDDEYNTLLSQVDREVQARDKEHHLLNYQNKYPQGKYAVQVADQLAVVRALIEEQDYEVATLKVNNLPLDEEYEQKAIAVYLAFLEQHPGSRFTGEINRAIAGIKDLLDASFYERLKKVAEASFGQRFQAYRDYLERFPEGSHKEEVAALLTAMGEEYFLFLKREVDLCREKSNWDDCIRYCDNYMEVFGANKEVAEVAALKSELKDRKDLDRLMEEARRVGEDHKKARAVFAGYLKNNPATRAKKEIQVHIRKLDGKIAKQAEWNKLTAYANSGKYNIDRRINRVEKYIEKNEAGVYTPQARRLLEDLLDRREEEIIIHKRDLERKRVAARQQQREAEKRLAAQRIEQQTVEFTRQVATVGQRFQVNGDGTLTDRTTGVMWGLLDSYQELNTCIDFPAAQEYAKSLTTGGFHDWRLPTSGELASIYKSAPFLPGNGVEWYWTSEAYVKGYHSVANIVTSKHETMFEREYAVQTRCGSVRVIRP